MTSAPPSPPAASPDVDTAEGLLRFGNLFCDARVLLTAVQLDLFSLLHESPATAEDIRERRGLHGRGVRDFLRMLVLIGVLREDDDGRFTNAPGADRFLVPGRPGYVGGFLHGAAATLYPAYGSLTEALRTGEQQSGGRFVEMLDDRDTLVGFAAMMDGLNEELGPELAAAGDWSDVGTVLDVGGCRGNLLCHVLRAAPAARGTVFDHPQMGPLFDEHVAAAGLADRLTFRGGDFFVDPLPTADVMICGHVLSDWSPEERARLLTSMAASLPPGGRVLIYDRMLTGGAGDVENLVASLTMLLMTEGGGEYTVDELAAQAGAVGLELVSAAPLGAYDRLVTFVKTSGSTAGDAR